MDLSRRLPALVASSPARRTTAITAAGLLVALAGCVSDPAAPADAGPARLAVAASVTVADADAIGVTMRYLRTGGSAPLMDATIPIPVGSPPGTSLSHPLQVELGPCLTDPDHLPGGNSCRVVTTLSLLRGGQMLDAHTLDPFELQPGQTATPAPVVLSEVSQVRITAPGGAATLFVGETLQLAGQAIGSGGAEVEGRALSWSSAAPTVATVDAATGLVTAVAPGTAVIRASAGDRVGELSFTVSRRPELQLGASEVSFAAVHGGSVPGGQGVTVADAAGGTLQGLVLGDVAYEGGQGWLTATLSRSSTPATLQLRPSRADLPAGTYVATVSVRSADALPQAVRVTYTVTEPVVLGVTRTRLDFESTGELPEEQGFQVTGGEGITGQTTATVEYFNVERDWLSVDLMYAGTGGGEIPPGFASVTVVPNRVLPSGIYHADVVLTAPGATQPTRVRVTYTVEVDYSDHYLAIWSVYEGGYITVGDSIEVVAELMSPMEEWVEGVPVTFSVVTDSGDASLVRLNPANSVTGQSIWVVATGPGSGEVFVTARVQGLKPEWDLRLYIQDPQHTPEARMSPPASRAGHTVRKSPRAVRVPPRNPPTPTPEQQ